MHECVGEGGERLDGCMHECVEGGKGWIGA